MGMRRLDSSVVELYPFMLEKKGFMIEHDGIIPSPCNRSHAVV